MNVHCAPYVGTELSLTEGDMPHMSYGKMFLLHMLSI